MDCFVAVAPRNDGLVGDRNLISSRFNRPGHKKIANHVGHFSILEEAEMRRLMHQYSHPPRNDRYRQEISQTPPK
jgi:hypothetical protein